MGFQRLLRLLLIMKPKKLSIGTSSLPLIVRKAIENAELHGIHVYHGSKIPPDGDCIFGSVIDNINSRDCFNERLKTDSVYWRRIWMTELESVAYDVWNGSMSRVQWKSAFQELKQPGVYNVQLGDFVLPGIAHCIRKNILVFNTSPRAASPVHVVPANNFGQFASTNVPVCLAYNQSHYEPLIPCSSDDIAKTVSLVNQVLEGSYTLRMKDIPLFDIKDKEIISVQSAYNDGNPSLSSEDLNKTNIENNFKSSYDKEFPPLHIKDLSKIKNYPTKDTKSKNNNVLRNFEDLRSMMKSGKAYKNEKIKVNDNQTIETKIMMEAYNDRVSHQNNNNGKVQVEQGTELEWKIVQSRHKTKSRTKGNKIIEAPDRKNDREFTRKENSQAKETEKVESEERFIFITKPNKKSHKLKDDSIMEKLQQLRSIKKRNRTEEEQREFSRLSKIIQRKCLSTEEKEKIKFDDKEAKRVMRKAKAKAKETEQGESKENSLSIMKPNIKSSALTEDTILEKLQQLRSIKKQYRTEEEQKEFSRLSMLRKRRCLSIEEKEKNKMDNKEDMRKKRTESNNVRTNCNAMENMQITRAIEKQRMTVKSRNRLRRKEKGASENTEEREEHNAKKIKLIDEKKDNKTETERKESNERSKEIMKKRRSIKTNDEKSEHNIAEKNRKRNARSHETKEETIKRKKYDRKRKSSVKQKKISEKNEIDRLIAFNESVRYGPIFICSSCEQTRFEKAVVSLDDSLKDRIWNSCEEKDSALFSKVFEEKLSSEDFKVTICIQGESISSNYYICHTCKKYLLKGKMPPMSAANELKTITLPNDVELGELENNLIAKVIPFQKVFKLPKSRMAAVKDKIVNIPVQENDILSTFEALPKTPMQGGLVEVKLKRKNEYQSAYNQAYIDPNRLYKAMNYLKSMGNPHYQFFQNIQDYEATCQKQDPEGSEILFPKKQEEKTKKPTSKKLIVFAADQNVEMILDKSSYLSNLEEEISSTEEIHYRRNDPIRRYQIDYDESVCLTEKFPEAFTDPENNHENLQLSVAPGEGHIPQNILTLDNWDALAFPMKHPTGGYNLHHKRKRKLSDQYYFVQRLRNKNQLYSKDPTYIFAAAQFLEKKTTSEKH